MPKPSTGRLGHNHRRILNGIFWLLRTGAPWREMPCRYGPWPTVANRFYRWRQAGIWERIGTSCSSWSSSAASWQRPRHVSCSQYLISSLRTRPNQIGVSP
ncbi:MAG: hypothetical protein BRC36_03015 [Cyanobacteria bacterium QH_2_48_84]|nr:MAG: hypothetical protein BRC36_03015 [Cyanobacteria bacterium QH_2_48_84]